MLAQEVLQRAFTKDGITFLEPWQLLSLGSPSGNSTAASGPGSSEGEAPTSSLRPDSDILAAEGRLMSHSLNPLVPSLLPPPPLLQRLGLDETYTQLFGSIPVSEGGAELLQVGFLHSLILPPFPLPFPLK